MTTYMWTDDSALYTHGFYGDNPTKRESAEAYLKARLEGQSPQDALIAANPCEGGNRRCPNACQCGCDAGDYHCGCHPDLPEFPED